MALTYSPEIELKSKMPPFKLPSIDGQMFDSRTIEDRPAKLIMFICAHCPYVQAIEDRLIALGHYMKEKNYPVIAICANDPTDYPEDSKESLLKRSQEKGYSFTYLIDKSQEIAKSFGAICTPDFFVYDQYNELAYRGRLDDSWKDPQQVTREELKEAMDQVAVGKKISFEPKPSMGCSIKWKS